MAKPILNTEKSESATIGDTISALEELQHEARSLLKLLVFCAENSDDDSFSSLRNIFTSVLYMADDKLEAMQAYFEAFYAKGTA